jgi:ATP-dependent DNA helicase RecG
LAPSWHQVSTKLAISHKEVQKVLFTAKKSISITYLMKIFKWKDRSKFRSKYLNPILELELIQMTIPEKPNSSKQKYIITEKGKMLLEELK